MISDLSKQDIINAVGVGFIKDKTDEKAPMQMIFVQRLLSTASLADLNSRSIASLVELIQDLWHFTYTRARSEVKVRVFNPKKHSTHTVIQVNCKDTPFLVDSVRMEINRYGFVVHFIIHLGGLLILRDAKKHIAKVSPVGVYDEHSVNEAMMHIEIDRQTDETVIAELEASLKRVLNDVHAAVEDWALIRGKLHHALTELEHRIAPDAGDLAESRDFLRWLDADHFTFLGYREYEAIGEGDALALKLVPGSGLGVLRDDSESRSLRYIADMPVDARKQLLSPGVLMIGKTNTCATVHRPVYTDYIGVKRFNDSGRLIGESRFIGLYTSIAYTANPKHIPFLRHKVARVMQMSALPADGHAAKTLLSILETLPRDDLFQASPEELFELAMGILHLQERPCVRLFIHKDYYDRFYSCYLYLPKEYFSTEVCKKAQAVLDRTLKSTDTTFTTFFSDSILVRIHFIVRVHPEDSTLVDVNALEQAILEATRSWLNHFYDELLVQYGEAQGVAYFKKYKHAFPEGYKEYYTPQTAAHDVKRIESISASMPITMAFYRSVFKGRDVLRLKLFNFNKTMALSDVLPLLENLGLRVLGERPNEIEFQEASIWINDFDLLYVDDANLNVDEVRENFQEALIDIWNGHSENDGFNRLILKAGLVCREVTLLRALAKYMQQIQFIYTQNYIEVTLEKYASIARLLVELFHVRFNPNTPRQSTDRLVKKIEKELNHVVALDEDRILRRYLELILAIIRTNFYQQHEGSFKSYLSFKFSPALISDLPLPRPMFEIFVYSPRVEGVHLRSSKVARGGIRWSDRRQDFRVEVLDLMVAQTLKNSVIVPSGAKGGFYPKQLPVNNRDARMQEAQACYRIFISALLDVSDNLKEGVVVPPAQVVAYDEEDYYLVVAADKGTATFSDIANSISKTYDFWLGDAFASGGSAGYDHKKMGITARGAWESVKRHFREHFNLNTQTQDFTVVGIGDMSGDVFGNGMLLSEHIKLVAAFNHEHIFIDPKPNAELSFQERQRLFVLPRSSWADYDVSLISKGGGVFSREEKLIKLTPEMKKLLNTKKENLIPAELIQAILTAEVDLLWNGGIGTYVKSITETHTDVGDRLNDAVRVNGNDLKCKVVCEGGNLGLTQLGRIEYALNKGVSYTDFIDNSAGVSCSDEEVNIKILLNTVVAEGHLTYEERNQLLVDMTPEVAAVVLSKNYRQTQAIAFSQHYSKEAIDVYRRVITMMEKEGRFDRDLEYLPSDKALIERKANHQGLTNPELAVLYAYSKNILRAEIIASALPDEAYFSDILIKAFPQTLGENYLSYLEKHPLRREIIATQLANLFVNRMGVDFMLHAKQQTGASFSDIIRAFVLAVRVFDIARLWAGIDVLDYAVKGSIQSEMLAYVYHLLHRSTRWFLKRYRKGIDLNALIDIYLKPVEQFKKELPLLLKGSDRDYYESIVNYLVKHEVTIDFSTDIALTAVLFSALGIVHSSAGQDHLAMSQLSDVYYQLTSHFELDWLRQHIAAEHVDNEWDETARYNLLDDLDGLQQQLAIHVVKMQPASADMTVQLAQWIALNQEWSDRWQLMMSDLKSSNVRGFTMYSVMIRVLYDITLATRT